MKKIIILSVFALAALVSCKKQEAPVAATVGIQGQQEIVIGCSNLFDVDVNTKATAVTSLPASLYWGATTGTSTETAKWSAASASVSSSKIATGKYQSATPVAYNYYVANQNFTVGATTSMTVANNNTDVIAGRTAASTSTTPSVTLDHIFARTGSLSLTGKDGYTVSGTPTWKIKSKGTVSGTAGTYNMVSGAWTASSASLAEQAFTSSSDLYLIPGDYTVTVTYTVTKGTDYTKEFTKSADVTLTKGKIHNMAAQVAGDASEIVISLSLTEWGTTTLDLTGTLN